MAIETTTPPAGRLLLNRIVIREKQCLQVQFLTKFAQIPDCQEFVLHGGAGLHGVYLHQRLSDDLDLVGPPEVVYRFLPLMELHGLALDEQEGMGLAYERPGALGVSIGIGIDLRGLPKFGVRYECRPFGFLTSRTVSVRVPPLADMLAEKLDCVTRRVRAVDFVDLWLGLRRGPETRAATFAALHARRSSLIYNAATAREHLGAVEAEWEEKLWPLMLRVPDCAEVRRDLEEWLV